MSSPAATSVRVSVDDLAVGGLPPICAVTGRPSTDLVEVEERARVFRPVWLVLLVFGPFGIAAIVLLYLFSRPGRGAGGLVPMHHAAIDAYNGTLRSGRRWALRLGAILVGSLGLTIAGGATGQDWLASTSVALAAVALVGAISALSVSEWIASRSWVSVELDGSGRWALLRGVHPDFARSALAAARRDGIDRW